MSDNKGSNSNQSGSSGGCFGCLGFLLLIAVFVLSVKSCTQQFDTAATNSEVTARLCFGGFTTNTSGMRKSMTSTWYYGLGYSPSNPNVKVKYDLSQEIYMQLSADPAVAYQATSQEIAGNRYIQVMPIATQDKCPAR